MRTEQLTDLDQSIDGIARHACRALLAMEAFRRSPDPEMSAAYREVHDLIGDLGSLRLQLGSLARTDPSR